VKRPLAGVSALIRIRLRRSCWFPRDERVLIGTELAVPILKLTPKPMQVEWECSIIVSLITHKSNSFRASFNTIGSALENFWPLNPPEYSRLMFPEGEVQLSRVGGLPSTPL